MLFSEGKTGQFPATPAAVFPATIVLRNAGAVPLVINPPPRSETDAALNAIVEPLTDDRPLLAIETPPPNAAVLPDNVDETRVRAPLPPAAIPPPAPDGPA